MIKRLVCSYWRKGGCASTTCVASGSGVSPEEVRVGDRYAYAVSCGSKGYRKFDLDLVEMETVAERAERLFMKPLCPVAAPAMLPPHLSAPPPAAPRRPKPVKPKNHVSTCVTAARAVLASCTRPHCDHFTCSAGKHANLVLDLCEIDPES